MPIRVLVADDHAVVRDGLKMILESTEDIHVAAMAADGREAVALAEELRPDVILMDVSMPVLNGIEATRMVRERLSEIKVLVLSMHHTREHVFRAMQAGACGYLLKESAGSEVVTAVLSVMKGGCFFGKGVEKPLEPISRKDGDFPRSPLETLSPREREVLQLVVEGMTSAGIATILSLSPKSVETYRSRLMLKLGVTNIPALVRFAMQHGISPAD